MNKWKKYFFISLAAFIVAIAFCVKIMTEDAYCKVDSSIKLSKTKAELDSAKKENKKLKSQLDTMSKVD